MSAIDGVHPVSLVTPIASMANSNAVGAGVYRAARVASVPRIPVQAIDAGVTAVRGAIDGSLAGQTARTAMTEPDLEQVVSEANTRLESSSRSMRFRISEDTGDLQIQIVDKERDKVIRSIPSDEMLRLSSRMRELSGIGSMVDTER